jgi:hypothetical protein
VKQPHVRLAIGVLGIVSLLAALALWRASNPSPELPSSKPAGCTFEGATYSEGALIRGQSGILVCRAGRWEPAPRQ